MKTTRTLTALAILFASLSATTLPALAERSLPELRQRFESRYPAVQQLKYQGRIGETYKGYLDAVKPDYTADPKVNQILTDENADRKELYQALAKQNGTTPDDVAARNATRNFDKAKPGEWLLYSSGQWKQKQ